ncbi:class I SAM-dependent methyltransferase [Pseudonocardia hydrocarbonoxydans]|uniref:SAM-dependent methyltransferase n=1 Tax=Pseudonocardia hydrocarbonoxydans TaxID=76726 RepID=A0A4Y3WU72_9PSEU|nr:class I SAM-dependent methyltransferase [Pseudonocardia hydrocarbonoxydans]GEC22452.1 SAM-dependent methyltransferase [Pseudonocardia hydrocarbonoxydans]
MRAEYRRLLTEAYDLDKPHAPEAELASLRARVQAHGTPALELMSGSARFLAPLLAAGLDVDGVDASPDMLAAARRRCAGLPLRQYEQALHELDLPRRYAFAFCVAGSFGLVVDDGEVAGSLARIRDHLLPGGRVLLEVEPPPEHTRRRPWSGTFWRRPDGATITLRGTGHYDAATQVEEAVGIYELFVDGALVATELNEWVRRFWTAGQITSALAGAGFDDVAVSERDGLLTATARRPDAVPPH